MMKWLDGILASILMAAKQPMESFIQLETADDNVSLVASDGSMVSFIKVHGSRQIIGDEEYNWLVDQATTKLGARFDRPGYGLQVYFMRDPSLGGLELSKAMRTNRSAARALDLHLEDLLGERSRHLARYLAHEEIYFVLWTRPSVLTKSELKRASLDMQKKKWVRAGFGQNPLAALDALRTRHKAYIAARSEERRVGKEC